MSGVTDRAGEDEVLAVGRAIHAALPTAKGPLKSLDERAMDLAAQADRYAERCRAALDQLTAVYRPLAPRDQLERDGLGPLPRANLSVKVSALTPLLRADAPELGQRDAAVRLRALLRAAKHLGA